MHVKTNLDLTEKMRSFAYSFLDSLHEVDGFILKNRSPTSAIRDARIYPSIEKKVAPISKGQGFFAARVLERFPQLAIDCMHAWEVSFRKQVAVQDV